VKERAFLVGVEFTSASHRRLWPVFDSIAEVEELSRSAGLVPAGQMTCRQAKPNPALFVGSGKAGEIKAQVAATEADVVVFEKDLSSSQQRNLEDILGVKTIDRTQLILDIFAQRARSTEGKLQVELAQLKYLLPRLAGKGIYLSRLGGGVGTRGPGEQKLEVDRRRIRERIHRLGGDLGELGKRRLSGIRRKQEMELPLVALVGYTNAGKSSLFNAITNADVEVKNKLFSTLDTTTRGVVLPGNLKALLVDTVGFVRELPHHLIESFQATLEEAVHADLLIHVVDSSRADIDSTETAVRTVLSDLGAGEKDTLTVYNKADLLDDASRKALFQKKKGPNSAFVSSLTHEGLGLLLETAAARLSVNRQLREIFVPREKLGLAPFLYEQAFVVSRRDTAEGAYFTVQISRKAEGIFQSRLTG
jgi:GTP-binding protein HflX